jgi:hypothetical protein
VDTWEGDEHSGQYGEDVFSQVLAKNQECFAAFSSLLRMTFDDAQAYFANESVDLLHIDGLHTYEAVRHDFETWLPKLAPGAVVLLHDTNVRERSFGVWKFWEELKARYPSHLEFSHSHGLGVLQLDNAPDNRKLCWLLSAPLQKQRLTGYFAALGLHQLNRYDLNAARSEVASLTTLVATLSQAAAQHEARFANLAQALVERDRQISALTRVVEDRDRLVDALYASTSWKITAPFRFIVDHLRKRGRN